MSREKCNSKTNWNDLRLKPKTKWGFINFYLIAYNHTKEKTYGYNSPFWAKEIYSNELINILKKYLLFNHRRIGLNLIYCARTKLENIVSTHIFNPWKSNTTISAHSPNNKVLKIFNYSKNENDDIMSIFANHHLDVYFNSFFRSGFSKYTENEVIQLVKKKVKYLKKNFNTFIIIGTTKNDEEMYFLPDMLTGNEFLQRPFKKEDIEIYVNRIK